MTCKPPRVGGSSSPIIFYNAFGYAAGLVALGAIESGIEQLVGIEDDSDVTVEVAD